MVLAAWRYSPAAFQRWPAARVRASSCQADSAMDPSRLSINRELRVWICSPQRSSSASRSTRDHPAPAHPPAGGTESAPVRPASSHGRDDHERQRRWCRRAPPKSDPLRHKPRQGARCLSCWCCCWMGQRQHPVGRCPYPQHRPTSRWSVRPSHPALEAAGAAGLAALCAPVAAASLPCCLNRADQLPQAHAEQWMGHGIRFPQWWMCW